MVKLFKLLGSEVRWGILCALADGPCGTTELGELVGFEAPRTSQELARLFEAGLVTCVAEGHYRFYELTPTVSARRTGGKLQLTFAVAGARVTVSGRSHSR